MGRGGPSSAVDLLETSNVIIVYFAFFSILIVFKYIFKVYDGVAPGKLTVYPNGLMKMTVLVYTENYAEEIQASKKNGFKIIDLSSPLMFDYIDHPIENGKHYNRYYIDYNNSYTISI